MIWGGIAYVAGGNSIGDGVVPESGYGEMDPEYLLEKDPDKNDDVHLIALSSTDNQ